MTREELIQAIDFATKAGDVELAQHLTAQLQAGGEQAPAPQPPVPATSADRGMAAGLRDVAGQLPGRALEVASTMATAPAKAVAGLADLANIAGTWGVRKLTGGDVPMLTSDKSMTQSVEDLRRALAGQSRQGTNADLAVVEGMIGPAALIKAARNVPAVLGGGAAGGVASEMSDRGYGAGPTFLASLLAGLSPAMLARVAQTSSINPMRWHAQSRLERALQSAEPGAMSEAAKTQALARKEGTYILPSQGSPRQTPGLEQLETEALVSHASNAPALRAMVLSQPRDSERLARELVRTVGKPGPVEDVANAVKAAAASRLKADTERINSITAGYYSAAAKNNVPIDKGVIGTQQIQLMKAKLEAAGNRELTKGINDLIQRLRELSGKKGEKTVTAPQVQRAYRSFIESLEKVDVNGVPAYSDNVAGRLRNLANTHLRDVAEDAEPLFKVAREMQEGMRRLSARGEFDQLLSLVEKSGGDPIRYLSALPSKGEALSQISRGTTAWVPEAERSGAMGLTKTIGASKGDVSTGLATALEMARQRAFSSGPTGMNNPSAGASFIREIAGTPQQRQELLKGVSAAGGDVDRTRDLLSLVQALGRPTVVHGANVPATSVEPITLVRAASPQQLQQTMGITRLIQAFINRMSDKQVIDILSQPESAAILAKIPGAKAMEPKKALTAVLLAQQQQMQQGN